MKSSQWVSPHFRLWQIWLHISVVSLLQTPHNNNIHLDPLFQSQAILSILPNNRLFNPNPQYNRTSVASPLRLKQIIKPIHLNTRPFKISTTYTPITLAQHLLPPITILQWRSIWTDFAWQEDRLPLAKVRGETARFQFRVHIRPTARASGRRQPVKRG